MQVFGSPSSQQHAKTATTPAVTINYGLFINTIIDFVIIAFAIFIVIKQVNRFSKPKPVTAEPTEKACPYCCSSIAIQAVRCPHCTSQFEYSLE